MKRSVLFGVVIVVLAAAGLAIALTRSTSPARTATTSQVKVSLIPTARRAAVPDFSLATATGGDFALRAERGHPVIVTFLAAGCDSCAKEVGALKQAYATLYGDAARMLLVDVGGFNNAQVLDYHRNQFGGGPHLYAADLGGILALGNGTWFVVGVISIAGAVAYLVARRREVSQETSAPEERVEEEIL